MSKFVRVPTLIDATGAGLVVSQLYSLVACVALFTYFCFRFFDLVFVLLPREVLHFFYVVLGHLMAAAFYVSIYRHFSSLNASVIVEICAGLISLQGLPLLVPVAVAVYVFVASC